MKSKILHLTLHRKWFDEIRAGEKIEEYREHSSHWSRRLDGKEYDEVRFVNGYGKDRPFMRVKCHGIKLEELFKDELTWIIKLGKILEVGNV